MFCRLRIIRGFTLIEMLVVLLIMGLLVGLVSLSARPDDRRQLHVEADRLAQLLNLAAEEARLTGKSIRWIADSTGYQFCRLNADGLWDQIRDNNLLRARTLPQGMKISAFYVEAMRSQGVMSLEFTPDGQSMSFSIEMSLGAERSELASPPVGSVRVLSVIKESNGSLALR